MLGCNGGVLDDYYYKARIFITNRLQNYFAMINRNHNPDKTCWAVSWLGLISWSSCMSPCPPCHCCQGLLKENGTLFSSAPSHQPSNAKWRAGGGGGGGAAACRTANCQVIGAPSLRHHRQFYPIRIFLKITLIPILLSINLWFRYMKWKWAILRSFWG